jgi:hypothetical protein
MMEDREKLKRISDLIIELSYVIDNNPEADRDTIHNYLDAISAIVDESEEQSNVN